MAHELQTSSQWLAGTVRILLRRVTLLEKAVKNKRQEADFQKKKSFHMQTQIDEEIIQVPETFIKTNVVKRQHDVQQTVALTQASSSSIVPAMSKSPIESHHATNTTVQKRSRLSTASTAASESFADAPLPLQVPSIHVDRVAGPEIPQASCPSEARTWHGSERIWDDAKQTAYEEERAAETARRIKALRCREALRAVHPPRHDASPAVRPLPVCPGDHRRDALPAVHPPSASPGEASCPSEARTRHGCGHIWDDIRDLVDERSDIAVDIAVDKLKADLMREFLK